MTMSWRHIRLALLIVAGVTVLSAPAYEPSAIAGVVTDETRGALPGVTVEASSPALFEGSRLVVTDGQGSYSIVHLRPGTYRVTFSVQGFNTVVREGIILTTSSTAPINVQMTVGALEARVTVSGRSPVVDVQSTQVTETLAREVIRFTQELKDSGLRPTDRVDPDGDGAQ